MNEDYKDLLDNVGVICIQTKGTSMQPLLVSGRDSILIEKVDRRLKKWEIALYKRNDGTYVLHRCIKVLKDSYLFCGDNHSQIERGITDKNIIGVAKGYYKNYKFIKFDKNFKYFLYKLVWCSSLRLRKILLFFKYKFSKKKEYNEK